jgi:hypothetical protein
MKFKATISDNRWLYVDNLIPPASPLTISQSVRHYMRAV